MVDVKEKEFMSTLESKYIHEYRQKGLVTDMQETIPPHLGCGSAESEWKDDPYNARKQFIAINSYSEFAEPSSVLLIGRIGTGKTSILNNLEFLINNGEDKRYKFVTKINSDKHFFELSRSIRLSDFSELLYAELEVYLKDKWSWLIHVAAMLELYNNHEELCNDIKKYLTQHELIDSDSSMAFAIDIFLEGLAELDNSVGRGAIILNRVIKTLYSPSYTAACKELYKILKEKGSLLILVDTINNYNIDDKISLAIVSSLYNVAVEITDSHQKNNILVKMALPSEIMPHLINLNTEKIINRVVYIKWNQKDLKTLIAFRLFRYKQNCNADTVEEALSYFDNYYSDTCVTDSGIRFNTFAYCLSHTQKKPRQLLSIFNSWLHLENKYPNKDRMELVNMAVFLNQELMVKGALSIFINQHEKIFEIFKRVFGGEKYCFSEEDLDKMIKKCSNIRGNLDAYDVKQLFLSSGLLGILKELHYIKENDPYFNNGRRVMRIKEVIFEYQIKDKLPINNNSTFALHPICYKLLCAKVDDNTLVYPKPAEDEFIPWGENPKMS